MFLRPILMRLAYSKSFECLFQVYSSLYKCLFIYKMRENADLKTIEVNV